MLEEAETDPQAWPRIRLQGFDSIMYAAKRRMLVGSGLYQMFSQLRDVILLDVDSQLWGTNPPDASPPPPNVTEPLMNLAAGGARADHVAGPGLARRCRPEVAAQLLAHLEGRIRPTPLEAAGFMWDGWHANATA